MNISKNHAVSFHFTLTNSDGEVLDSSKGAGPLIYLHGAENLLPKLEEALAGKAVSDKFTATIAPKDAYGEVNPDMIKRMPRQMFDSFEGGIKVGMEIEAKGPNGEVQHVVIQDISDEGVLVNSNHPFAGQTLIFDIEIDSIREATEDEIKHRHIHTAGCNH